jgi:hydrogenase maturation factor
MDPLGALASGSLIVCCEAERAEAIVAAWEQAGIPGSIIGAMTEGPDLVLYREGQPGPLPRFASDEVTKAFSPA